MKLRQNQFLIGKNNGFIKQQFLEMKSSSKTLKSAKIWISLNDFMVLNKISSFVEENSYTKNFSSH